MAATFRPVEPVVDWSEKIARLIPLPDRARAAPCSARCAVPRFRFLLTSNRESALEIGLRFRRIRLRRLKRNSAQPPPAYCTVRVALPLAEVARLKDIRLLPGMPAEVFIQTHDRTPLQYLLKPLQEQIARTFRER
jgi:hypothetical protein